MVSFLEVLHSNTILKINQGRIRVLMKNQLLRILMHHYSKFKVTVEGASLMIENDLEKFDEAILRHRLMAPVAPAAAAG